MSGRQEVFFLASCSWLNRRLEGGYLVPPSELLDPVEW